MRAFLSVLFIVAVAGLQPALGQSKEWMVRMAKIEIDSAYLEPYKAAIREHTQAAIANEPGVLTLYAMYDKARPTHVTVLEIYASKDAYQAHLKTPHFQKYKAGTLKMVKSLELIDVDPIAFGAKPNILER
ncbi:putative quinol monooxygenase [Dyadobacter sp.]|uniref:putative quinol monooxygenase n=1 Tax=Dyadobacter sp. TaxID=1914288 RepID=UPI0025C12E29|nr:antibiotic biosynthesis monooxygenase [Dyadobacter sp.]